MLRLIDSQQLAVNAARRAFNEQQTAMASRLAVHGSSLEGNAAPVPIDAWRRIDARSIVIQRDVLAVFNALSAASSTPVGMGDLVSYYPQISDSGEVTVTMDGRQAGRSDQANVKYDGTPVPIFASEARFGWRQMEVVRKGGGQLDTVTIENHMRKVAEKAEDVVLNGESSIVVNGATIYGLRNHPQRNTDTHGFDLNATATGANWLTAFKKLIDACVGDNAYGKITVFLNYADWVYASVNEFTAGYPKTILQRLREIEQIRDIIPASKVPADNILGIAGLETGSWGSILNAMPMVTRPKARMNSEDDYVFSVMMAAVPQFRQDFNGQMPIAHLTAS